MPGFDTGGGGGRVQTITENSRITLSKPYEIPNEWSPDVAQKLDEMLRQLYEAAGRVEDEVDSITETADQLLTIHIDLTPAHIQNLTVTPVTIIAAPGGGKFIRVVSGSSICDVSVAFNATVTADLRYAAATTHIPLSGLSLVGNTTTGRRVSQPAIVTDTDNANIVNSAVEIIGTAGVPPTGAFNGSGCRITVAYYIEDSPY